jgi:hypothetical protein
MKNKYFFGVGWGRAFTPFLTTFRAFLIPGLKPRATENVTPKPKFRGMESGKPKLTPPRMKIVYPIHFRDVGFRSPAVHGWD